MATADDSMEYTERLASILQARNSLSADMRIKVEARAKDMIQHLTTDAGEILHTLDVDKHSEDEVKTLITQFPSALSHLHGYRLGDERIELLPIQGAMSLSRLNGGRSSIPFIPLLAEERDKYDIGGEGQRGGLLAEDPRGGRTVLKNLAIINCCDSVCLDVLKRLRQSNLLKKEDIRQYDLLWSSCIPEGTERFEYLVDWDPKALKECQYQGNPLLHRVIVAWGSNIDSSFTLMLKAGLKHYPEELGFLFQKNGIGETAFQLAFDEFGKAKTLSAIEKCLEENTNVKLVERNPVANLYPFMLAAAGETSDLNTVNYLLRRDPEVLYRANQVVDTLDCVERKRKLSSGNQPHCVTAKR